ncbi:MAG TPA: gluconokinase [Baekduia sp.]|uniref:gluconokinase n=1 Tax=Baekduia sp. TaxID=2600305 RepID=UPI002D7961AC|nr:gluconokinase [Baekduia sp.]HET6507247.1 gluconokinase [Baekduia sp.]
MTTTAPVVVVGIDIGTTSAKAGAFDADGRETGSTEIAYPLTAPRPGWAVQEPGVVVDAVVAATRQALAAARAAGLDVAGLSCSTAMHSLIGLGDDDAPLTDIVTWADQRAAPQAERLRRERPELHGATGTPLHPMAPLTKLVWFREEEPARRARAARWVGVKELIVHRLTGAWLTDHSTASGTGLLALGTLEYHDDALAVAGVRREQLPDVAPSKHIMSLSADGAKALGCPPDLPLVLGAGDGPLANLGVGATRPGVAACSIGTSGALRLMVEKPVVDRKGRVFCYALTEDRWVVGGAINNGGVVLRWIRDALTPELGADDDPETELMNLAAQAPPGSDRLVMLPYLLSERAPHWSTLPRGAYVGLTRGHRREHLVRAAIEGVCQQMALVLASLRDAGNAVDEIRATGGFARSALWRQMLCDTLGQPVGFPDGHQGSGFGAALLGMEALGAIGSFDRAAELIALDEVREPDPGAAETYKKMLPVFDGLYDALAPAFAQLRDL